MTLWHDFPVQVTAEDALPQPGRRTTRRVALVTQGFGTAGGVASVAEWLRSGLTARGYQVDVHVLATSSRDVWSRRLRSPASWRRASLRGPFDLVRRAQSWGATAVELEPMRYARRSELTAALREYDLIQVVSGGAAAAWPAIGAGPPVFLQVASRVRWERAAGRGALSPPARLWGDAMTALVSRLEARALAAVDGVFVENSDMAQVARLSGQNTVCVAPPGVDTTRFHPRVGGWRPDGYLLSVCRLAEPRKRLDRLVGAYGDLVREHPDAPELVLAGQGSPPDFLRRLAASAGVSERVKFRAEVPADELPELYRGAAAYLQTSQEEGLGIAVLEAMASGLPVVATDTAGAKVCVRDGETGFLISQDDEQRIGRLLTAAVTRILSTSGAAMAVRGRAAVVEDFSTDRSLDRFTSTYDEWFGNTSRRS